MGVRSQGQNLGALASPTTWQELGNWDRVGSGLIGGETGTWEQSERAEEIPGQEGEPGD